VCVNAVVTSSRALYIYRCIYIDVYIYIERVSHSVVFHISGRDVSGGPGSIRCTSSYITESVLYIYTHICIHTYIYIYTYMYMYICVYI